MHKGLIVAVDQGTTNTKGIVVDADGEILVRTSTRVALSSPQSGWVEADAEQIWLGVQRVLRKCLDHAGAENVAGIGISNQRESIVLWDRETGEPAGPVILWQCRRSAAICAALAASPSAALVRARTGLPIDPLFSSSKLAWMLEHRPTLRAQAEAGALCFGTIDSWLLWKLTGGAVHATDRSNASRTQLLNIHTGAWDPELLAIFGIPHAVLPALCPSSHIFGVTRAACGLPPGIAVACAIADSHAALLAQGSARGSSESRLVKATYGTGSSLMTLTGTPDIEAGALAQTIAWEAEGRVQYALEGNITMTGATTQWLGHFLQQDGTADTVLRLAEEVESSVGVYLVPAMSGLGAPYWDNDVQGAIYGLRRNSTVAHLAYAALESTAFQVAELLDTMKEALGGAAVELHADGGASENRRLMQLQADLLGLPVYRSGCAELSAMGAAWLAGLAVGIWPSLEALLTTQQQKEVFQPAMPEEQRALRRAGWRVAVARTRMQPLAPLNHRSEDAYVTPR